MASGRSAKRMLCGVSKCRPPPHPLTSPPQNVMLVIDSGAPTLRCHASVVSWRPRGADGVCHLGFGAAPGRRGGLLILVVQTFRFCRI